MKYTVYDFFDADQNAGSENSVFYEPSAERIKVLTMKKIKTAKQRRSPMAKLSRLAAVAAAVAILSVTAYAVSNWTGFMDTSGMSDKDIQELMVQLENSGCIAMEHDDGSVTYFDSEGKEIMTLTAKEEAQFRQTQREEEEKALRAQRLIDIDSLELWPDSITTIPTGDSGTFGDFLLGNGRMVALCAENEKGYELHAGETVTISVDASAVCYVQFGMTLNGNMVETEVLHSDRFEKSFTAPEDGEYCFTLMYTSVSADNFTNGTIQIN